MEKYRSPYLERRRKVGWDLYSLLDIKKGDYKKTLRVSFAKLQIF